MFTMVTQGIELTGVWQLLCEADVARIGSIIQNQSTNAHSIYISVDSQPSLNTSALELVPNGALYEDLLPAQARVFVKGTAGEFVTFCPKMKA